MHFRGVAQLIARSVWDREVEGLSPFTPTIEKRRPWMAFFYGFGAPQTLDLSERESEAWRW